MNRLYAYMARYRRRYAGGIACLFATATFAMSIPVLMKYAIDAVAAGGDRHEISLWVGAIIVIACVQGLVRTLSRSLIFNVGRDIEYDLRNDLFAHLQSLPPEYYQRQQTGDLMSRLVNDLNAVRMLLGPGVLNLFNTPVYYLYAVTILFAIDVKLTLLSLAAYPLVLWIVKGFSRRLMERMVSVQQGLSEISSRVQENLSGIGVVKAYALEEAEVARFAALNADFRDRSVAMARMRGLIVPVMKVVSNAGLLVVLWYGGRQVMRGELGIGDLVAVMAYLHLLAWPTMAMGWMLSIVQRGRAAMLRLDEILSVEPTIVGPVFEAGGEPAPITGGEVEFEGVSFTHPGTDKPVLRDVTLRVPAGSTLAVVGRTGSGKTSLVNLVPRLFDATTGVVRVDGRDVRDLPLSILRRGVAFVPQDPFLFSTTLRRNIAFGAASEGDGIADRVEWAAAVAALGEDLDVLPMGLETTVGERGVTLSGGQKQRVTIARALAYDAPIVILDDSLSSVDGETEKQIRDGLREACPGRTQIIVTHRVSTLEGADQILVLDEGRVVGLGPHEALVDRCPVYADLFREQMLEDELESL